MKKNQPRKCQSRRKIKERKKEPLDPNQCEYALEKYYSNRLVFLIDDENLPSTELLTELANWSFILAIVKSKGWKL